MTGKEGFILSDTVALSKDEARLRLEQQSRFCATDWPVSVHEAHTLRAHVTVGGEDASGRVHPLAPCRAESIHSGHTLLGANHVLLWIFTLITNAFNLFYFETYSPTRNTFSPCIWKSLDRIKNEHISKSNTWYSHDANLSSSCGTGLQAFCAGDASLGAPASREQPVPLQECAPVTGSERKTSHCHVGLFAMPHTLSFKAESDLFLHQILQMGDPLCILWVTADIVLIKEGLL